MFIANNLIGFETINFRLLFELLIVASFCCVFPNLLIKIHMLFLLIDGAKVLVACFIDSVYACFQ